MAQFNGKDTNFGEFYKVTSLQELAQFVAVWDMGTQEELMEHLGITAAQLLGECNKGQHFSIANNDGELFFIADANVTEDASIVWDNADICDSLWVWVQN